jgi:hypothetical protein
VRAGLCRWSAVGEGRSARCGDALGVDGEDRRYQFGDIAGGQIGVSIHGSIPNLVDDTALRGKACSRKRGRRDDGTISLNDCAFMELE